MLIENFMLFGLEIGMINMFGLRGFMSWFSTHHNRGNAIGSI
jgi:hypothetical protein